MPVEAPVIRTTFVALFPLVLVVWTGWLVSVEVGKI
jgi:hypothetical protein